MKNRLKIVHRPNKNGRQTELYNQTKHAMKKLRKSYTTKAIAVLKVKTSRNKNCVRKIPKIGKRSAKEKENSSQKQPKPSVRTSQTKQSLKITNSFEAPKRSERNQTERKKREPHVKTCAPEKNTKEVPAAMPW